MVIVSCHISYTIVHSFILNSSQFHDMASLRQVVTFVPPRGGIGQILPFKLLWYMDYTIYIDTFIIYIYVYIYIYIYIYMGSRQN